jgi:type IV secretory pathway protease TraF
VTRFGYVVTTYFTTLAVGLSAFLHPAPKLIWNASASFPVGLYAVQPAGVLRVTELVVIRPPEHWLASLPIAVICPKACGS